MNGEVLLIYEELLLNVEPLSDARTAHGKSRVLARQGRAEEKSDSFSILLLLRLYRRVRPIQPTWEFE